MPSHKSMKQTIEVKMKQIPVKKKKIVKSLAEDSISQTISFVIKGKLTPIKPTFVSKKIGIGRRRLNVDKKANTTKLMKEVLKKKEKIRKQGVSEPRKTRLTTNLQIITPIKKKNTKDKSSVDTLDVSITPVIDKIEPDEILCENDNSSVTKSKKEVTKAIKTTKQDISDRKLKKNTKAEKTDGNIKTKTITKEDKISDDDIKKKRTIAKLLKQANRVLKQPQLKVVKHNMGANKIKPKKIDSKALKNTKNVENPENIIVSSKTPSKTVEKSSTTKISIVKAPAKLKVKSIKKEVKPIIKKERLSNDEACSSDDITLEELRKPLKASQSEILVLAADKSKISGSCAEKVIPQADPNSKPHLMSERKKVLNKKVKKKEDPRSRKLKLFGYWNGPKRHRVASLNALAKVHCLYENEGRSNLIDNIAKTIKKEKIDVEEKKAEAEPEVISQRTLRSVPGLRAFGKHWDMQDTSSSSSEDNSEDNKEVILRRTIKVKKEPIKKVEEIKKTEKKRKRKQPELVMDLKDMVVRKRMASLNATAILAASYSQEKRSTRSPKSENGYESDSSDNYFQTDDDDDEDKCEIDIKKEDKLVEVRAKPNKKVAVILNQDTDVTITGVYVNSTTRSTHHEGYCSIAGMQYRISATSHTQTAATAVATETLLQSSSSSTQENSNSESLTSSCKSYTPLDALSNMQPPASNSVQHSVPHQNMGPPQHVMPMPPHQLSPSGIRHGCNSAFTAPHASPYHGPQQQHHPPQHHPPPPLPGEPGYIHGYYQPAGPLINVPHGHGQPPLTKSAPLSDTSPSSTSPVPPHPHQPAPSSNGGDSSDSEVIITSVTAGKEATPPAHPQSGYRYSPYPQGGPPPGYSSYAAYPHYYHPTPPPPTASYSHHDMCYSPGPYIHHKYTHGPYRRYLANTPYYPSSPQEMYQNPPSASGQPNQQVVTTTPVPGSSSSYQPPVGPPPMMDPYPPTLVETYPPHYYPGCASAPSPYFTHPPRTIPYMNPNYQSCPCPMQSCSKNGLTGPLTGDSKRSVIFSKDSMPLPPVALALPVEPPGAKDPPSPARGSAGMPPPPSPAGATYQQPPAIPKHENGSPENEIPVEKKRKARIGKAMVRNNIQNTMLLMCNPVTNYVKREIESPKEKEVCLEQKTEILSDEESKINTTLQEICSVVPPIISITAAIQDAPIKVEEKVVEKPSEPEEEPPELEPIVKTVAENVKVKNMKRKLSLSGEKKEETSPSPAKKQKIGVKQNGSYKNLIKRDTNVIRINNGKRKLILDSKIPQKGLTRTPRIRLKKSAMKRKAFASKDAINNNNNNIILNKRLKQSKRPLTESNLHNSKKKFKEIKEKQSMDLQTENQEPSKKKPQSHVVSKSSVKKLAPAVLDNLIAKNNVDRTIECVIVEAIRTTTTTSALKSSDNCKIVKEPVVPTSTITTTTTTLVTCNKKNSTNAKNGNVRKTTTSSLTECRVIGRRKSKCKEVVVPQTISKSPRRSLQLPKWSNGWNWEGESYESKVFLNSDETTIVRRCYPAMRHHAGDLIEARDCVLLKAGPRKNDLPFVAKIAALWENPEDGEMMMSLLWYYRPEHTEQGRLPLDQPDEVFASRHKDSNSVACIDDKCYVLTYNEYCRYRKQLRRLEDGIEDVSSSPCIPIPEPYPRSHRQPPQSLKISPEMVFFCRRVYDFRQKRIVKNPT